MAIEAKAGKLRGPLRGEPVGNKGVFTPGHAAAPTRCGASSAAVFQQSSVGPGVSVSAAALSPMVPEGVLQTIADFRVVFLPLISVLVLLTLRDGQGRRAIGAALDQPASLAIAGLRPADP